MKVYLDNNIIVDIENGVYDISSFKLIPDAEYYYSETHIDELIEGESLPKIDVDKRLLTIETLSGTNHILNGLHNPEFCPRSVNEMHAFSHVLLRKALRNLVNTQVNTLNLDRDFFLRILKLRSVEVNNINPCAVFQEIENRLLEAEDSCERISINEYLDKSKALGRSEYCTLFNLLDFACFHKDKFTEHSNIARMHDASHAYFAQLCDVIVSNDKKMMYKTKAVYSFLGVKTQVMSGKEYLNLDCVNKRLYQGH